MSSLVPAPDGLVGGRFDVAAAKMLGVSRAKAAELIEAQQVRLLGRTVHKSSALLAGDVVEFDIAEEQHETEPIADDMAIAYEDEDVVVVDKPVGVAAHASVGWAGPTVLGSLIGRGVHITSYGAPGRQGIVSRLDVGTSGLMLVCKSELAYKEMRRQFAQHEVVKIYHALVQGNLTEDRATVDAPIGRAKVSDFRFTITPAGKPAITHWDVLERFGKATLASVNLETGRTHQIRVHFSSIGHPLVGDAMYGANPVLGSKLGLDRQWLHAMRLEFRHPRTHVWTTVDSHYPPDLQHALDVLGAERADHDSADRDHADRNRADSDTAESHAQTV
ncbi:MULTISPECIES: RluA family pseudouridine synthase [Bifidobacterium]|jgi:23S rRNA pseudouridine1911/1915/1917 synthase|uniref:Pseudouridine synthase n=1 Tax=Bifidobacterium tibiigranuli TaxID=2172043 RepID=A0A5N6S627_9BIFI|nr:RluA family pseudouridine synthase [Bifidobacterium tibiigranuli]KAE8128351.1 RluA family pseudouridine synthase [Bifidobacterium tibiigranuli]KAE8128634.1 RluA family pseudouridine synthase [Bifidobacterium tibiigranuli]MCH3974868.1 RluA family pseudouridine synthase [Bifidobacterium tibiigranuli]MCH4190517.1 RluA family pseudouridine synthase [Bifidobacterium tibiigranuli]MCH4202628.1 RluA family pseudouridine synthase [Bifidobacterium tibiigranuli]